MTLVVRFGLFRGRGACPSIRRWQWPRIPPNLSGPTPGIRGNQDPRPCRRRSEGNRLRPSGHVRQVNGGDLFRMDFLVFFSAQEECVYYLKISPLMQRLTDLVTKKFRGADGGVNRATPGGWLSPRGPPAGPSALRWPGFSVRPSGPARRSFHPQRETSAGRRIRRGSAPRRPRSACRLDRRRA